MTNEERAKLLAVRSKLRGWPPSVIKNWYATTMRKLTQRDKYRSASDYMDQWEKFLERLPLDYQWDFPE